MNNKVKYPDLEDIQIGSTWTKLFKFLYTAGMLRYSTKEHLNQVSGQFGTPKKLTKLRERGFLTAIRNGDVYVITKKTRLLLEAEGFQIGLLQDDFNGLSVNHELKITDYILQAMQEEFFYFALFPNFTYMRPDALLVYKKSDREYKLVMLEIENEKSNWNDHLEKKRENYQRLSKDIDFYNLWKSYSEQLGLPYCTMEQFCFSVLVVGNIKFECEGWKFRNE